jgi:hypothetical protein
MNATREQVDRAIMQLTLAYLKFPQEQWTENDYATVPTLWTHKCNQDALDRAAKIEIRTGKPPCVNSDARKEMTHDDAPEFEPCPICKATDPNFDGYCQQCEVALERKP